jgi:hypothetical protein
VVNAIDRGLPGPAVVDATPNRSVVMSRTFKGTIRVDIRDSKPDCVIVSIIKVVYAIADDVYVDMERELAATLARD